MKISKEKIQVFSILFTFLIGIVVYGFWSRNRLEKEHLIGNAKIYHCQNGAKGNAGTTFLDYQYIINDKEFKATGAYLAEEIKYYIGNDFFVNKTFPIVYYPPRPSISRILITPRDFSDFNMPFPDSLKWVLQYYKK